MLSFACSPSVVVVVVIVFLIVVVVVFCLGPLLSMGVA